MRQLIFTVTSIICICCSSAIRAHSSSETQPRSQKPIIEKILRLPQKDKFLTGSAILSTILVSLKELQVDKVLKKGFQKITLHTQEGLETYGYTLMKSPAYPTIVLIAGLGSAAEMSAFRHYIAPFIDAKWNIVLLENATNSKWIARNHVMQVSGYEAGWSLYQTLKSLREHPQVGSYITTLNLMGLSLGGNDAVFASYFDSKLGTSVINGAVLAWSSPVNRLASLKRLREVTGLIKIFSGRVFSAIYDEAYNFMEVLTTKPFQWFVGEGSMDEVMREVMLPASISFLSSHPTVPKPTKNISDLEDLETYKKLFKLDDYLKYVKQPVLWIHAMNDSIVLIDDNISSFRSIDSASHIGLAITNFGGHLGYPKVYGKRWVAGVVNAYFDYWLNPTDSIEEVL